MTYNFHCNNPDDLTNCAKLIDKGGVIIFPTDTVYGIGCDPTNDVAVLKLYSIKKRPLNKTLPLLTFSESMVSNVAQINLAAQILMEMFWPGQLTIVMKTKEDNVGLSKHVIDLSNRSIALRIPNNDCLLDLISATESKFLVGTSANFSQQPSSNELKKINPELISKCDAVFVDNNHTKKLDRGRTITKPKKIRKPLEAPTAEVTVADITRYMKNESTIVDVTNELHPRIIREGAVPKDKIIDALKVVS